MAEKTPEQILTEEVYVLLRSFVNGGYVEAWTEYAQEKQQDLESLAKAVEEQTYPA